jgi:hypothetical protein
MEFMQQHVSVVFHGTLGYYLCDAMHGGIAEDAPYFLALRACHALFFGQVMRCFWVGIDVFYVVGKYAIIS